MEYIVDRTFQGDFLVFHLKEASGDLTEENIAGKVLRVKKDTFSRWLNGHSRPEVQNLISAAKFVHKNCFKEREYREFQRDFLLSFDFLWRLQRRELKSNEEPNGLAKEFLEMIGWKRNDPPLTRPDFIPEKLAFAKDPIDSIWLNPHNHHSLPLTGRDAEIELLEKFIHADAEFLVAALIAPSGAGKTRLVSEWMKNYIAEYNDDGWDAGFVTCPDPAPWQAENWTLSCNTVIIVDYTYNYRAVLGVIMDRFKNGAPYKIRLLVLDHVLPDKLQNDIGWGEAIRSQGFREGREDLFFKPLPIELAPASDDTGLLREVIATAADPYTKEKRYNKDSFEVHRTVEALMKIGAVDRATATSDESRGQNAIRHPLFAALMGQMLGRNPDTNFAGMSRRDLISHYFEGPRRLPWLPDADNPNASAIGLWVGVYVSVAVLLRGLEKDDVLEFQELYCDEYDFVTDQALFNKIFDICNRFVSSSDKQKIKPFEPDILGEAFFLKFIEDYGANQEILNLLASALTQISGLESEQERVGAFLGTMQRLARNLINDDSLIVNSYWDALRRFLSPKRFPKGSSLRSAASITSATLIKRLEENKQKKNARKFSENVDIECLKTVQLDCLKEAAPSAVIQFIDWKVGIGDGLEDLETDLLSILSSTQKSDDKNAHLRIAAAEGCVDAAKYTQKLIGGDLHGLDSGGWSLLHIATYSGRQNFVEWIIEQGVELDQQEVSNGSTALMLAVVRGYGEIAGLIIETGADLNLCGGEMKTTALHRAIITGRFEQALMLVENGADLEIFSAKNLWNALLLASAKSNVHVVKKLLDAGANPNVFSQEKHSALYYACSTGKLEIARTLLESGAEIDFDNKNSDRNALMVSVEIGHIELVKILVDAGANLNVVLGAGASTRTALAIACERGDLEIAKTLVEAGAAIDERMRYLGPTALFLSCLGGHKNIVEFLLLAGADINNACLDLGYSPLMAASMNGHIDVARLLVDVGAEVDHLAADGKTSAILLAISSKHDHVLEILASKTHDIDRPVLEDGATLLLLACSQGFESAVDILLDKGARTDVMSASNGWSPLIIASSIGNEKIVSSLINAGASVNYAAESDGGWTALMAAAENGFLAIVRQLVLAGSDIDQKTTDIGWTALMAASSSGEEEVVSCLCSAGADVNAGSTDVGMTALMMSVFCGNIDVPQILVSFGSRVDLKSSEGKNAFDLASEHGFSEVEAFLKNCAS